MRREGRERGGKGEGGGKGGEGSKMIVAYDLLH